MLRWIPTVLLLSLAIPAMAQNTSRLGREVDRSRPRTDATDEARRRAQNEAARNPAGAAGENAQRMLRMPDGTYRIAPDKYRPDWWSPRFRRIPDYSRYSPGRFSRGFQHARNCRAIGGRSCGRPCGGGGWHGAYGVYDDGYGYSGFDSYGDAYEQGRFDADSEYMDYIAAQRAGQALDASRAAWDQAMVHFQAGRFDRAAIGWLNAAALNHGDAKSRVYAGHALFAVGRYDEAIKLIARAFELAPQLAGGGYDIRADYTRPQDFDAQLRRLQNYVAARPDDAAAVTLLGYVLYYSDGPAAAYPALARAHQMLPGDYFIPKLLNNARLLGQPSDGLPTPAARRSLPEGPAGDARPALQKKPRPAPPAAAPRLKVVRSDSHT